ncbi:MAG: SprB repeat-containing protein, partial [Bacteroidota bacterium]
MFDLELITAPAPQPCMDLTGSVVLLNGQFDYGLSSLDADHTEDPDGYSTTVFEVVDECIIEVTHFYEPRICQSQDPCLVGMCNPQTNQCEFQNTNFEADVVSVNTSCGNNGMINTTIAGGVSPYTSLLREGELGVYDVNIPFNTNLGVGNYQNLASGEYQLTLTDARGCQIIRELEIEEKGLSIYVTHENAKCFGASDGSIQGRVEHGTQPYTVTLLPQNNPNLPLVLLPDLVNGVPDGLFVYDFFNLPAGLYKFEVVDAAGCVKSSLVSIGQFDLVQANITVSQPVCNGANAEVTVMPTGGEGGQYEISFDGGLSYTAIGAGMTLLNFTPGVYQAIVRTVVQQCYAPAVTFSVNPTAPWNIGLAVTEETCAGFNDGTITVTAAGSNGGPFQYSINDGPFQAGNVFTDLAPGDYTIKVKDSEGCISGIQVGTVIGHLPLTLTAVKFNPTCWYNCNGSVELEAL